jgi:hydroxymethylbilane synthase
MTRVLRLATRSSDQAMAQSRAVAAGLEAAEIRVELVPMETLGDLRADVPLHSIGGQGVFVKEVQRAVLDGHADLAVHSAKDLPSTQQDGLLIGAFGLRRSPRDALVGRSLAELEHGATVASGSVRRRAQLHRVRPDLQFVELRGNIGSRLAKVPEAGAIVMAVAALEILDRTDRIAEILDPVQFVPAVGQGAVAVECRWDDEATLAALSAVDHLETRRAVEVERAFLAELGSGCFLPVGAHVDGSVLATFLADTGSGRTQMERIDLTGDHDQDLCLAREAAHRSRTAVE